MKYEVFFTTLTKGYEQKADHKFTRQQPVAMVGNSWRKLLAIDPMQANMGLNVEPEARKKPILRSTFSSILVLSEKVQSAPIIHHKAY